MKLLMAQNITGLFWQKKYKRAVLNRPFFIALINTTEAFVKAVGQNDNVPNSDAYVSFFEPKLITTFRHA